ncbi:MAG TPA: sigma-54-dependent Fis family transcriptional regulator, partial [Planctomycetes bacterium]|nr:sigma-54-dependent Fis family transcriptional regulator [Planctomycetota bacterium]
MKARLLIVDDEAPLRRALARSLRREGYEVNEAEDGERALLLLEQGEYEVVLLDLRMPGRPGLEVLREIKQRWPLTEVIVLTGHGSIDAAI